MTAPESYCLECDALPGLCSHTGRRYLEPVVYERVPGVTGAWRLPGDEHAREKVAAAPPTISALEYLWSRPSLPAYALEQLMAAAIARAGGFDSLRPSFRYCDIYDDHGELIGRVVEPGYRRGGYPATDPEVNGGSPTLQ